MNTVSRHMWAIVCDDIRQEVGNKPSYMGIYTSGISVPAFPATMGKLCVVIHLRTAGDDPFKSLVIRILKDDTELVRINVTEEQLTASIAQVQQLQSVKEEPTYYDATFVAQFAPLVLEQACLLRFRAETEREELRGGSVRITAITLPVATEVAPAS